MMQEMDVVRLGNEINTAMDNSDKLPWRVLMILLGLTLIGASFEDTRLLAGWLMIIVGFGGVSGQCFYDAKIRRLGARFKRCGSEWEYAKKSPFVGIFAIGTLCMNLMLWAIGISLWHSTSKGNLSEQITSIPVVAATYVIMALTLAMLIVLPLIPKFEAWYNHRHS